MPSTQPGTLLLDGAMGTSLAGRRPEPFLRDAPDRIRAVHAAHVAAGAELVLTATFGLGWCADAAQLAVTAVRLARQAGAPRVAGAVGPEGDLARAFAALADAGADLLWAETHWDLRRAREALAAARATGLPAAVTLAFADREPFALPAGGAVADALRALADAGAAAVGVNCVPPSEALARLVAEVAPGLPVPFVAKPSPGLPGALLAPGPWAERLAVLAAAGASWLGGCCGATAAHVDAAAQRLHPARSPRG